VKPNRSIPDDVVVPVLVVPDVREAVAWFGEAHRSQLRAGGGAVIVCDVRHARIVESRRTGRTASASTPATIPSATAGRSRRRWPTSIRPIGAASWSIEPPEPGDAGSPAPARASHK
jgi:hypothetical protein